MLKKLTVGCLGVLLSVNCALAADKIVDKKIHKGKVLEYKDSGGYTYMKLEENGKSYWAAVPGMKVKVGDTVTIKEQMWMNNFTSKTLNEKFDKIMFADFPKKQAVTGTKNVHNIHGQMMKKKSKENFRPEPKFNKIVVAKGEAVKTTISALYDKKAEFKNKNVEVEGEVLQVSNKVMGNTWVKIFDGKDAMIFRSPNKDEKVAVGDKVKVSGTLNTDVDYDFGFKYEIIGVNGKFTVLEKAKPKKAEKKAKN